MEDQSVTAFDFKTVIRAILKQRAAALMNQREDQEAMIEELQQTTGGGYARQMI